MDLSILIPARNEQYLEKTIADINAHKVLDIEVLWMEDDGLGQRGCTTELAKKAQGRYIMKTDGHCSFSHGFDLNLLEHILPKTILAPMLMPLDGESWSINGKKQMSQFRFGSDFVMQHHDGPPGETMCLQGSCWVVLKEEYFNWNLGDPNMPSWGGQAVELGIKAFLNGGKCMTTSAAYYGHVFRAGDADFPYDRGASPGKLATEVLIWRYRNKSIAPLIERFGYPVDWTVDKVNELPVV